jgi:hypothetical protein
LQRRAGPFSHLEEHRQLAKQPGEPLKTQRCAWGTIEQFTPASNNNDRETIRPLRRTLQSSKHFLCEQVEGAMEVWLAADKIDVNLTPSLLDQVMSNNLHSLTTAVLLNVAAWWHWH